MCDAFAFKNIMTDRMGNDIVQSYIKGLRNGSHKAFNAIYDLYSDRLFNFVYAHTKSNEMAEDVVQDTFLNLWQKRKEIQEEKSLHTLLYTISKHKVIDIFRKQINESKFMLFMEYMEEGLSENNVERKLNYDEFNNTLKLCKKILSERQLEVFELSREKGKSIKEIAAQLNLSEQTVKNQLSTSLKKIREQIEKYYTIIILLINSCFIGFL